MWAVAARADHARTMAQRPPQIVAFGGGGFSMEAGNPLLDDYVLGLTGAERPKVCFLPTASGDADHYIVRFYRHFAGACEASHVSLFRRDRCGQAVEGDIAGHLLAQDLVYVGGGNVVSMLGAWRAHGLDAVLRRGVAQGRRAVRAVGRLAVLVRRGADGVPRRAAPGARPRAAARTPTACTTTTSRSAARSTTASSATGCAPATRPTTARRCTSAASELHRVVVLAPARAGLPGRAGRRRGRRDAAGRPPTWGSACAEARRRVSGTRTILAMGGGGFTMEPDNPALDDFVLGLAGAARAADPLPADRLRRPGGADRGVPRALRRPRLRRRRTCRCSACTARAGRCARSCSSRTSSTSAAARCATCSRSGARTGSTRCSTEAWERGIVLAGLSAGAMCWFEGGITRSSGPPEPIAGLGLLPGSLSVHADGEPERLPAFLRRGARRRAAGRVGRRRRRRAAVRGTGLVRAVSSRPGAGAVRVDAVEGELVRCAGRAGAAGGPAGPACRCPAGTSRSCARTRGCGGGAGRGSSAPLPSRG